MKKILFILFIIPLFSSAQKTGYRIYYDYKSFLRTEVRDSAFINYLQVGGTTQPTARLHIKAGTATAGTGQIKLSLGLKQTTGEDGTINYDTTSSVRRLTFSVGTTYKQIPLFTNATPGNGELLIGNGTDFTKATLASADASITITNGAGTIDLAAGSQGTYMPTCYLTTNVADTTTYTTHYKRIGDWVHVWGEVDIDATAATTMTEMGMSLPVTTGATNTYDLAGTAAFEDNTAVQIAMDVANGRAKWRFTPQTNTMNKYSFHFSYKWVAP